MAVHNGMPYLEKSVRSILAQTLVDFEFVIGDDGSSDGGSALLRRLAEEDPRIRLLRRDQPSGLAASANWVVGEAKAPWVAIAHADDVSLPQRLERQMAAATTSPDVVLVGALAGGIDEGGRGVHPPALWRATKAGALFAPFPHSSVLMRRAAFDAVGGYRSEADYWEDYDLYLRLLRQGRALVVAEELCRVRHSRGSTRLRDEDRRVYESVDLMFRTADAARRSGGGKVSVPAQPPGARLVPMTFVARGAIRLWAGHRPRALKPMLRQARLQPNGKSLFALGWAVWGAVHPPSLRGAIRAMLRLRNRRARHQLGERAVVEWRPW